MINKMNMLSIKSDCQYNLLLIIYKRKEKYKTTHSALK